MTKKFWKVERILAEKVEGGVRHFLIRWKGWVKEFDSWESEDSVNDCALEAWEEAKEKKKERKRAREEKKRLEEEKRQALEEAKKAEEEARAGALLNYGVLPIRNAKRYPSIEKETKPKRVYKKRAPQDPSTSSATSGPARKKRKRAGRKRAGRKRGPNAPSSSSGPEGSRIVDPSSSASPELQDVPLPPAQTSSTAAEAAPVPLDPPVAAQPLPASPVLLQNKVSPALPAAARRALATSPAASAPSISSVPAQDRDNAAPRFSPPPQAIDENVDMSPRHSVVVEPTDPISLDCSSPLQEQMISKEVSTSISPNPLPSNYFDKIKEEVVPSSQEPLPIASAAQTGSSLRYAPRYTPYLPMVTQKEPRGIDFDNIDLIEDCCLDEEPCPLSSAFQRFREKAWEKAALKMAAVQPVDSSL